MTPSTKRRHRQGPILDQPLLLDEGPDIDQRSLALAPDLAHVTWMNGQEPREAPLG